jgi:hypothetical protein
MMIQDQQKTFVLVSQFSQPHLALLEQSFQTVFVCRHNADNSLKLIEVSTIQAVVAMVPHQFPGIDGILFYLIKRPGLDLLTMSGAGEDIIDKE